jgi:arylformamidase
VRIYDITIPLKPSVAVWPGDTPYVYRLDVKRGPDSPVNIGSVTMSVHAGTHADAPYHFREDGPTIGDLDPSIYIGPAVVVDAAGSPLIRVEDFRHVDLSAAPRVLLKTNAWTEHTAFPRVIPVMEDAVPDYLHAQGVILVGVDVPSVDALDSKDLPIHHALAARDIHILESLALAYVPAGRYQLIALPLRLVGADGAPVRAVLAAA